MDFNLAEEQELLLASASRFVREQYTLERHRAAAEAGGYDADNWARFADMGWLMLPIPEPLGGIGGSPEDVALLMTVFGQGLVIEPYITTVLLCGTILGGAPDAAMRAHVERIAAGELRVALAHDEGGEPLGADAKLRTTTRRGGDGWLLSGGKRAVLDAPWADKLIVSASAQGELVLFLVDRDAAGVAVAPYRLIDGSSAADIQFDEVPLADSGLIAIGDAARALLAEGLDRAALGAVAQSVGSIEAVLDLCSEYLKTREQFGRPIGKFQALQHIMAAMFVETQEARSSLYCAIAATREPPSIRARALAQARVVVGQAAQLVSRQGLQLHGAYGMTEEFAVGHHFKRLLTLEKLFGDAETHLGKLADDVAAA
jgi:alkylation response protein AidB-like acyl-CoA dehydrogenase